MSLSRIPATAIPPFIYGADPELFLEVDGKIIGSERIIPEVIPPAKPSVVRDGVQVELHPSAAHCRVQVGGSLAVSFQALSNLIAKANGNTSLLRAASPVKVCWRSVVQVDEDELAGLSESSKHFGCQESLNIYGDHPDLAGCNAETYRFRGAGGHIHIGLPQSYVDLDAANKALTKLSELSNSMYREQISEVAYEKAAANYSTYIHSEEYLTAVRTFSDRGKYSPDPLIQLLDIIVGNTGVMLDREPLAPERRRYYGRAGEYRLPDHGIEYRVLSNWWARAYPMASFVWGMTRLAGSIFLGGNAITPVPVYREKLLSLIDIEKVRRAINENNLLLAKANWAIVRDFIDGHVANMANPSNSHILPLGPNVLEDFEYFLSKGIDYWFPPQEDHLKNWVSRWSTLGGWEVYLTQTVRSARRGDQSSNTPTTMVILKEEA